ncbi:MAG TPA: 2-oxoglutarate and iron-dependent oxygenase domain-containing protein [Vineibacter sp.]|nr:2-oxoglutarate and iron-dependent oxygenase domain-containing protein [Vineibacter sp.]
MSLATATRHTHQDEEIPVLDLAPYLAGAPGALEPLAAQLRHAFEHIGFYFIKGHGVPPALTDAAFAEAARFHAQPLAEKMKLERNQHNVGYLPMKNATKAITVSNRPNLNEAFFVKRDLPADHPDVVANKRFRGANLWPADLPGFRETVVAYCDAMEALALALLPIYARALDLPADYFARPFSPEPQYTLRLSHYPPPAAEDADAFGIAPHTDTSFLTILAQNRLPGLSIRTQSGKWIDAPAWEGHFLVNGGDMLRRWTNDRFLATPHRAINRTGRDRYAIPFFFDCTADHPIACLPTCQGPDHSPKYPPFTYTEYMIGYQQRAANQGADGTRLEAY